MDNLRQVVQEMMIAFDTKASEVERKLAEVNTSGFEEYASAHADLKREAEMIKKNFETLDIEVSFLQKIKLRTKSHHFILIGSILPRIIDLAMFL